MRLQESGEMYLETILILTQTKNYVRSIDVCEYMGYSKPSISRAGSLLRNDGYVDMDDRGFLSLTDKGRQIESMIENGAKVIVVGPISTLSATGASS